MRHLDIIVSLTEEDDRSWTADAITEPSLLATVTEGNTRQEAYRRAVGILLEELSHRIREAEIDLEPGTVEIRAAA